MQEITLEAKRRTLTGKEKAKKLRKKGLIPAVVYGPGDEPLPLEINAQSLNSILRAGKGENVIITLNIDNDQAQQKKVLIREIQQDPVVGNILHVDFQHVLLTKKITVKIPVELTGIPVGVSKDGGILQHALRELEIECLPTDIPEKVEFDVAAALTQPLHCGVANASNPSPAANMTRTSIGIHLDEDDARRVPRAATAALIRAASSGVGFSRGISKRRAGICLAAASRAWHVGHVVTCDSTARRSTAGSICSTYASSV